MRKRILSFCIVFILFLTLGSNINVQATVTLNKTKAIMEVDSTLVLRLKGNKNKVKWKSSDSNIAKVSSKGTVSAKAEGKATITATIGKSKYTCAVTVVDSNKRVSLSDFDATKVSKKLKVTHQYEWSNGKDSYIAIVIKNNSDYVLKTTVKLKLYASDGSIVGYKDATEYAFGPDNEFIFIFPIDEDYASYDYEVTSKEDKLFNEVVSKLKVEYNITSRKVIFSVTNNGFIDAKGVGYTILYFKNGQVVDFDWGFCVDDDMKIEVGKTKYREAEVYNAEFDSVKIYLSGRGDK